MCLSVPVTYNDNISRAAGHLFTPVTREMESPFSFLSHCVFNSEPRP